jgi:hypothetical protein
MLVVFLYYLDKRNFPIKLFSRIIYIQFHSGATRKLLYGLQLDGLRSGFTHTHTHTHTRARARARVRVSDKRRQTRVYIIPHYKTGRYCGRGVDLYLGGIRF